jgi:hypothetical protein
MRAKEGLDLESVIRLSKVEEGLGGMHMLETPAMALHITPLKYIRGKVQANERSSTEWWLPGNRETSSTIRNKDATLHPRDLPSKVCFFRQLKVLSHNRGGQEV